MILPVHTIYFGGGTPSLLPPEEIGRVLLTLEENYELAPNLEVSLEANPGTVTKKDLSSLKALGVNRLSLGMQSAHPDELSLLGREHGVLDCIQAVKWARQAGFVNLNLDLIFDLPGQTVDIWEQTLNLALSLTPDHFSLYGLTIEEGTPLNHWVSRGLLTCPNPDLGADMYELACDRLAQAGYQQYEISNWSKLQFECRHNLQYWQNLPYLGFGVGAHGFVSGFRTENISSLDSYIQCFQPHHSKPTNRYPCTPATQDLVLIDVDTEIKETMMMGLRLTQTGVSKEQFQLRFDRSLDDQFGPDIKTLVAQGLLELSGDHLRLTPKGRLLGNQVFQMFI